jgi:hypothetical protein
MTPQILFGIAVVPAIIGLVEVGKDLGLPTRAAPAIAVILGILAGLAQLYATRWAGIEAIVLGIALGLSACGLYAGMKTIIPTISPPNIVTLRETDGRTDALPNP